MLLNLNVQNFKNITDTWPVQRQHQHTDCIYDHHTEFHENRNNKMNLAILL